MLCRHCGTDNQAGNRYCMKCGRKLDTDIPEKSRGWAPQEARKKTYAQLAAEEDCRKREDRIRRREDGKTLAGIAAVIAAAVLLLAGVSAGAYALITHSDVDSAAEMNYTSADSAEDSYSTEGTLSGTAETAQTEVSAQPSEAGRVVVTPELSAAPSPSPSRTEQDEAEPDDEAVQPETDAPYDDPYGDPYADPEDAQPGEMAPDTADAWGEPEYPAHEDMKEHTDDDGQGPDGFLWDIITGFYSIGAEAA